MSRCPWAWVSCGGPGGGSRHGESAGLSEARAGLAGPGVEVSEIQQFPWGALVFFSDPDGNGWAVQQIMTQ